MHYILTTSFCGHTSAIMLVEGPGCPDLRARFDAWLVQKFGPRPTMPKYDRRRKMPKAAIRASNAIEAWDDKVEAIVRNDRYVKDAPPMQTTTDLTDWLLSQGFRVIISWDEVCVDPPRQ